MKLTLNNLKHSNNRKISYPPNEHPCVHHHNHHNVIFIYLFILVRPIALACVSFQNDKIEGFINDVEEEKRETISLKVRHKMSRIHLVGFLLLLSFFIVEFREIITLGKLTQKALLVRKSTFTNLFKYVQSIFLISKVDFDFSKFLQISFSLFVNNPDIEDIQKDIMEIGLILSMLLPLKKIMIGYIINVLVKFCKFSF